MGRARFTAGDFKIADAGHFINADVGSRPVSGSSRAASKTTSRWYIKDVLILGTKGRLKWRCSSVFWG